MKDTKFAISQSPLTNNIYVGRLNKEGSKYLEKKDMTMEAISSVVDHIRQIQDEEGNNTISISAKGKKYSLTLTIEDM
jgi:hypothetical protein